MKNLFHRILKALNINGRDWAVLLLALLLAFSIWMIHNLSLKYNDSLSVPVTARCDINGHSAVSANRCEVIARCRTTGYKVLRSSLKSRKPVELSFDRADMQHLEGDMFYVSPQNLVAYSNSIYGTDVTVEYFMTDTLFFRFPYETCRKVPVVPVCFMSYRNQYMADGELEIEPDSVLIYGEPYLLEEIGAVYTRPLRYYDISKNIRGVTTLENIKGIRYSVSDVSYSLEVKRFVELSYMFSVKAVNVPSDKIMTVYPSVAKVFLRCDFPLVDDPYGGLSIEADYNDFSKSLNGQCELKAAGLSRGVIDYEIEPVTVTCVIEDRLK